MRRAFKTFGIRTLLALLLLVFGFGLGWVSAVVLGGRLPLGGDLLAFVGPGTGANSITPQALRQQFSVFWEVWNLVESEFYSDEPIDRERMIHGAIHGMLSALDDQHTVYQEPELAAQTNEHMQGKQAGIGTYLRITDGHAYLYKPFKDAPAARAGLVQDDELVTIDGQDVVTLIKGLDVNESAVKVAGLIRGDPGTQVVLTVRRASDGELIDVTLTREEIVVSSVTGQMLDDGIAYIKISEFKANTTKEFDATLKELLTQNPQKMILDLRSNPGGYLQNAQEVLGRFYSGVALYEQKRDADLTELSTSRGVLDPKVPDLPLVVLVNGNTASASEIVSGALRDQYPSTILLGEKTYGKGSVQYIHPLSDGGSARITIAHWLTPNKSAINKVGITPQYVVPYNEDASALTACVADRQPAEGQSECADSQLYWAIQLLTTGETPPVVATAQP